ncbi:tetratricopeptide repeat-containing protein [Acinetobacter baumannii]|uniref:tetratricopeptide repeat-containing protein n=1 Tax=Acinetobacter baumannii TaxID=470 RepID=UPI002B05FA0A|nr:tetratricopeptide repeat-containing protein [Acinetobacter baumannii]
MGIVSQNIDSPTNPVRFSLAGAINKRLWNETRSIHFLEEAIVAYKRGFILKRDYYNGENLTLCNLLMSEQQVKGSNIEAYHLVEADKVAKDVLQNVKRMLELTSSSQRTDYKWILATAAKLSFFLNEDYLSYEKSFKELADEWELDSYLESKQVFFKFLER